MCIFQSKIFFLFIVVFSLSFKNYAQPSILERNFNGDAQIEAGSYYSGLEFHHSSPMLQRISFYYPSANSLDQSIDYWKRDSSYIMAAEVKFGGKSNWLNNQEFEITYSPFKIKFKKSYPGYDITIQYRFMKDSPGFAIFYNIINTSHKKQKIEFYTNLEGGLRTSHTYNLKTRAKKVDNDSILFLNYDDIETRHASLFSFNKGEKPAAYSLNSMIDTLPAGNKIWWQNVDENFSIANKNTKYGAFRYLYKKDLSPSDSLSVIQIYGSIQLNNTDFDVSSIYHNYMDDIMSYERMVLDESGIQGKSLSKFYSGVKIIDNSLPWVHSVLTVNKHYIDGTIQPMPCPAEYNFYFTHDVLLTNLAAVNFDIERCLSDYHFIVSHSREDSVIPHAYYWKDSSYKTEYAEPDNWNHFWFIIGAAKILLHSTPEKISFAYPQIYKSMNLALSGLKEDLMSAKRPDWWDIGNNYGPRAYMTILAIKSIREFIYLSSMLNEETRELKKYTILADKMQDALFQKLWDHDKKYFFNILSDGSYDYHYYSGSLLSSHFNLIDEEKKNELVSTAAKYLLNNQIGIYNSFPMDYHKLIELYHFNGNEAGDQFYYMNGGIWPQGNAWYALGLIASGQKEKALDFIKNIMTIDGILNSPNGQPGFYEVRTADTINLNHYGKMDKPQFMWSAGWYLYTLYNLFILKEGEWNITLDPWLPKESTYCSADLVVKSKNIRVTIIGQGNDVESITYDNKELPSLVIPEGIELNKEVLIRLGNNKLPIITDCDSRISRVEYSPSLQTLSFNSDSFEGKTVKVTIKSPLPSNQIQLNGKNINFSISRNDEISIITFSFTEGESDKLVIRF